jgi:predicted dehydrogenase
VAAPAAFAIVGTGWRSRFFVRIAAAAPEHLRVDGVVTRSAGRAAQVSAEWGVPAYTSVDDLLRTAQPDFVIVSVPWAASPEAIRDLAGRGVRVLAETRRRPTSMDSGRSGPTPAGAASYRSPSSTG